MNTHKRKKAGRFRGSKTHGYGSMKKNRGAGHRGGVGNAGTGKRADTKKPSIWADTSYFGKHGFNRNNTANVEAINISFIESYLDRFDAKVTKDKVEIDLTKEGFDKLLGTGNPTKKYVIKVEYVSTRAKEKIESAGGEIVQPNIKSEVKSQKSEEKISPDSRLKTPDSDGEATPKETK